MNLARIIGSVWATAKQENLSGYKLQIIQPLTFGALKPTGKPVIAINFTGCGKGDLVYYVTSKEAALPTRIPELTCVDAGIVGQVDRIDLN